MRTKDRTTLTQAAAAVQTLRGFIGPSQLNAIGDCCRGEEREWFKAKLVEMAGIVSTMPKTYEQDGLGENAVAHLHYFTSSYDFHITERDSDQDGEGQIQAFGFANLGYGPELGYISIKEIIEAGAELDLHWKPITLAEIRKAAECPECNAEPTGPIPSYCRKHDGDYGDWLVFNNID